MSSPAPLDFSFRVFALCLLALGTDGLAQALGLSRGLEWRDAQLWGAAVLLAWFLLIRVSNRRFKLLSGSPPWWWILVVAVSALSIRAAVGQMYQSSGYPTWIVIGASVGTTVVVLWSGLRAFPRAAFPGAREILESSAPFLVLSLCATRLLYAGQTELLSQEAYYWKYAEHLTYGYLDHPPAVAALIYLGQAMGGINELGVRVLSSACWFAMALCVAQLANEWFGKGAARGTLLLLSILPFFTAIGFYMTPDSPLVVCWAAALFFLHRALLRQQGWAWYAVGVAIGLGMFSKYPMVLMGPGILGFMVLDRDSRKWLWSPQPYSAALLAFLIFSPVLYWNAAHEWASFTFQGARRFEAESKFSVHMFITFFFLLLTPVGAYWMAAFALPERYRARLALGESLSINRRVRLFVLLLAGAPLVVFLYASISQEIKVNWLGPAMLAAVPVLALAFQRRSSGVRPADRALAKIQRGWLVTVVCVVGGVHAFLFYLGVGWSTLRYPSSFKKFLGRSELAAEVMRVEREVQSTTGMLPVVMGADSHYIGSLVGFYRAKQAQSAGQQLPSSTQGRYLLGGAYSLMYRFWSDPSQVLGRPIVMVSRTRTDVEDDSTARFFERLGEIQDFEPHIHGQGLGHYFIRVGYGYRGF